MGSHHPPMDSCCSLPCQLQCALCPLSAAAPACCPASWHHVPFFLQSFILQVSVMARQSHAQGCKHLTRAPASGSRNPTLSTPGTHRGCPALLWHNQGFDSPAAQQLWTSRSQTLRRTPEARPTAWPKETAEASCKGGGMQAGLALAQANAASGVLLLLTKLRPNYFIVLKSALRQVALVCWSWSSDCQLPTRAAGRSDAGRLTSSLVHAALHTGGTGPWCVLRSTAAPCSSASPRAATCSRRRCASARVHGLTGGLVPSGSMRQLGWLTP